MDLHHILCSRSNFVDGKSCIQFLVVQRDSQLPVIAGISLCSHLHVVVEMVGVASGYPVMLWYLGGYLEVEVVRCFHYVRLVAVGHCVLLVGAHRFVPHLLVSQFQALEFLSVASDLWNRGCIGRRHRFLDLSHDQSSTLYGSGGCTAGMLCHCC